MAERSLSPSRVASERARVSTALARSTAIAIRPPMASSVWRDRLPATPIALAVHHGFAARDNGLELVGVQIGGFDPRTIDVPLFRDIDCRGRNVERLDDVVGDGVQQLQNVIRGQQLLAEAVEAFQFAAAADGLLRLLSRAVRQLTGNQRGGEKSD